MAIPKRGRWLGIVAVALVLAAGCGGDDDPVPLATATASVAVPAVASPTPQPGIVGTPEPLPGRVAPDVTLESLTIAAIRVFADPATGLFTIHANLTNSGAEFLNNVELHWQIFDASGQALDQGDTTITALAPGETTSLVLTGSAAHDDGWDSVSFEMGD